MTSDIKSKANASFGATLSELIIPVRCGCSSQKIATTNHIKILQTTTPARGYQKRALPVRNREKVLVLRFPCRAGSFKSRGFRLWVIMAIKPWSAKDTNEKNKTTAINLGPIGQYESLEIVQIFSWGSYSLPFHTPPECDAARRPAEITPTFRIARSQ